MKRLEYAFKGLRAPIYRLTHSDRESFKCPICGYHGPFMDKRERREAKCPSCGEVERARLLHLVLKETLAPRDCSNQSCLHIAPENAARLMLRKTFGNYLSADLRRTDVDQRFDIQEIPFPDSSFDLVVASYVLEYAEHDRKAMTEIHRVLRPGGLAILPVPLLYVSTIDRAVRDGRTGHMHDPGMDYFERFEEVFSRVDVHRAESYSKVHQLFRYRGVDANDHPLHLGDGWHSELVPVCFR